MPNETAVKGSESAADGLSQDQISSGESRHSSGQEKGGMSEEKFVELLKKKDEAIGELREQMQELRESHIADKEERLQELNDKSRLSASEERERASLSDQVAAIRSDPKAQAWLHLTEDTSLKSANAAVAQYDAGQTEDFVTEIADKEGIPFDKFEKEIVKLMRQVDPGAELTGLRRAKKAYKQYQENQAYQKRSDDLKQKERQFAEVGGSKPPRPQTKAEILDGATKSEKGLMEALKAIHAAQEEATSR